jgi:Mg2+ and Co2+ transporter CorA
LDLKVRQWYGQYPSGLNVDELWILAVDAEHVVTFSSNQSWKSRWPPLQLASRISDVSFRGIRNTFFRSNEEAEYTAMTHVIASLSGAVGMLHRNFWPDMILCLSDRYSGHLGNLQYRLHRTPSTKLVMDLIACQEELNIVIQITEQQIDMISELQSTLDVVTPKPDPEIASITNRKANSVRDGAFTDREARRLISRRSTFRQLSSSLLSDPVAQLIDNLERELIDLRDLRDNTDRLVNRTIQLVNIRLEDHGKAILVFTVVTIIFLPLNFVSSFFGINTADIRDMAYNQWIFWVVAITVTACVVASSIVVAFAGGDIMERMHLWRNRRNNDARKEVQMSSTTVIRH